MSISFYSVNQTSPLKYSLQSAEKDDSSSSDDEPLELTADDCAKIESGSLKLKLVIHFRNPFWKRDTIVQNIACTSMERVSKGAKVRFTFEPPKEESFYFSRGYESCWSKVSLVMKDTVKNEKKIIDVYRQFITNDKDLSCSSLNGRLALSLDYIKKADERELKGPCRKLFSDDTTVENEKVCVSSCEIHDIFSDEGDDQEEVKFLNIGYLTKIASASVEMYIS